MNARRRMSPPHFSRTSAPELGDFCRRHLRGWALALMVTCGALAQCDPCETPGNQVGVDPLTFMSRVEKYSLPDLKGKQVRREPDDPVRLEVTVNMEGKPCKVVLLGSQPDGIGEMVRTAISTWTFRPPMFEGRRLCWFGRPLIYVRRVKDEFTVVVPGLPDRDGKK